MDYTAWTFWERTLQFVLYAGVAIFFYFTNRRKATVEMIDDIRTASSDKHADINTRLALLEEHKSKQLSSDDMKEMYVRMRGIEKGLSRLEGRFESIDSLNQAIQQIALERNK